MSTPFPVNEDVPILVEFEVVPGREQVSRSVEDLAAKSAEALDNAMGAIYQMARRTYSVVRALPIAERPAEIEVDFNLKLTSEAGVVLAKAGLESSINVKLKWQRDEAKHEPDA
jgi:predicted RecB family nuclease